MKPETREWVESSEIDLEAASACLDRELYGPCVSHCQQAVEKMLKAIWLESGREEIPPRTHNLVDLADTLGLLEPSWEEFLRKLSNQAVVSRYSGRQAYSREMTVEYYEGSHALCAQLRQRLN